MPIFNESYLNIHTNDKKLAYSFDWEKYIHGTHSLTILILFHIEGLYFLRIVSQDHRTPKEIQENMDLAEEFIKYCVRWALDNCADDVKFLNDMFDKGLIERLEGVLKEDFVRLPYTEGIKILEEAVAKGHKFEFPVYWGVDLASEHERYLVEDHFRRPVILTDYPKEIKAFYMKQNEDGKTSGVRTSTELTSIQIPPHILHRNMHFFNTRHQFVIIRLILMNHI